MVENVEMVLMPDDPTLGTPAAVRKDGVKFNTNTRDTSFSTIAETPDASRATPGSLHVRVLDDSLLSSYTKTPASRSRSEGYSSWGKKHAIELDTPPRHNKLMTQMIQDIPSPAITSPSAVSETTNSTVGKNKDANLSREDEISVVSAVRRSLLFNSSFTKSRSMPSAREFAPLPVPVSPETPDVKAAKSSTETPPADTTTVRRVNFSPDTPESQPGRILPSSNLRDDASWCNSSVCPFDCVQDYEANTFPAPSSGKSRKGKFLGFFKKGNKSKPAVTKDEPAPSDTQVTEAKSKRRLFSKIKSGTSSVQVFEEANQPTEVFEEADHPTEDAEAGNPEEKSDESSDESSAPFDIQVTEAKTNEQWKGSFLSMIRSGSSSVQAPQEGDHPAEDAEIGKVEESDAKMDETVGASRSMEDDLPSIDGNANQQEEDSEDDKAAGSSWNCKKCLYWVLVPLLLLSILLLVGVLAKRMFFSDDESNAINDNQYTYLDDDDDYYNDSGKATSSPTANKNGGSGGFGGGGFGGGFWQSKTEQCDNAQVLEESSSMYDNMMQIKWDDATNTCGDSLSFGYAIWYKLEVEASKFMEASTCNAADYDTQITVMSGTCGKLSCVTFNDNAELCGDQSKATWYAEEGTTYYVVVSGFREEWGESTLTVEPTTINDQCEQVGSPLQIDSTVSGTTAGASTDNIESCEDVDISKPGVWYQVSNVEGPVLAEAIGRDLTFEGQVSVYHGSCGALVCESGSKSGTTMWEAKKDTTYYVYVNGLTQGDFDLYFGVDQPDTCYDATAMIPSNIAMVASTNLARPQQVESCGFEGFSHSAPGLWYSITGNGNDFVASTCGAGTKLDTEISVFKGSCDALECIGGSGQASSCDEAGNVRWRTVQGEEYFVYVSGRGNRVGNFWLTLEEEEIDPTGTLCLEPIRLGAFKEESLSGSTSAGSIEAVDVCDADVASSKGVWYKVRGNGEKIRASVCDSVTDFDARISLYNGTCGSLECLGHTALCGEEGDFFEWDSILDHRYTILVHGADEITSGDYVLSLNGTVPTDDGELNDQCALSLPIDSVTDIYLGSTINATLGGQIKAIKAGEVDKNAEKPDSDCKDVKASHALWYKIVGNGGEIIVSTCSDGTDFDTVVDVFAGSCGEPTCIISNNDGCGTQSLVRFNSELGTDYFISVRGNKEEDVGNFSMGVTVRTPIPDLGV